MNWRAKPVRRQCGPDPRVSSDHCGYALYPPQTDEADKIVATGKPATLVQQPTPDQAPVDASALRIEYIRSQDLVRLLEDARIAQEALRCLVVKSTIWSVSTLSGRQEHRALKKPVGWKL
ncbi:MAG: hypothetical protein CM15mP89_0610 [Gammaproteobacteria bacterium]|nr:MAG: hypothetical protein CM15mP89_0610 [Gammaproteobacteria bacterium]